LPEKFAKQLEDKDLCLSLKARKRKLTSDRFLAGFTRSPLLFPRCFFSFDSFAGGFGLVVGRVSGWSVYLVK
jgi:hypothetical protein